MKTPNLFRHWRMFLPALLLALLAPLATPAVAASKPLVVATLEPLSMLARDFYGDRAEVKTLLLPSQNPHHASFTPQQLLLLHNADLVIWLGAAAEPYMVKYLSQRAAPAVALLSQPGVTPLIETLMDPDDPAPPGGIDPHLWTDPVRMSKLLPALVAQAVAQGLPKNIMQQRADALKKRLLATVAAAKKSVAPLAHNPWLSYHNPWHYMQKRLGIDAPLTVVTQPGAESGSQHFLWLAQQMQQRHVGCMVLEPEARRAIMERLCKQPTCKSEALDPLGRDAAGAGYIHWWTGLVGKIQQCLAY